MSNFIQFDRDDVLKVPVVIFGHIVCSNKSTLNKYINTCKGELISSTNFAMTGDDLIEIYEDSYDGIEYIQGDMSDEQFESELAAFTRTNEELLAKYAIESKRASNESGMWYHFLGNVEDLKNFAEAYDPHLGDFNLEDIDRLFPSQVRIALHSGDKSLIDFEGAGEIATFNSYSYAMPAYEHLIEETELLSYNNITFRSNFELECYINSCSCKFITPNNFPLTEKDCLDIYDYDTLLSKYNDDEQRLMNDLNRFSARTKNLLSKLSITFDRKETDKGFYYELYGTFSNLNYFADSYESINAIKVSLDWFDEENILIDPDSGNDRYSIN